MKKAIELFENDLVRNASREIKISAASKRFAKYLPDRMESDWLCILAKFAIEVPWKYYDELAVSKGFDLLIGNEEKAINAINRYSYEIDVCFNNLFRNSSVFKHEGSIDTGKPDDLFKLSLEINPEYLRIAEHIFGNVSKIFVSVCSSNKKNKKLQPKGICAILKNKGHECLYKGYIDKIRNGIAHGQITYKSLSIEYGSGDYALQISPSEFLRSFDDLWRTSNGLSIALLLFIFNQKSRNNLSGINMPSSLAVHIAGEAVSYEGMRVVGVIGSEALEGEQLNIALTTPFKNRMMVILDCLITTYYLSKIGFQNYKTIAFRIDQEKTVSSLLRIDADKFSTLLQENCDADKVSESVLIKTSLLWLNENLWFTKIRLLKILIKTNMKLALENMFEQWREIGFLPHKGSYFIKSVENKSNHQVGRLEVHAVLKYPEDAQEKELCKKILKDITAKISRRWILKFDNITGRSFYFYPKRPTYIWVNLYKYDGPQRFLRRDGWAGGNIVAMSEKVRSFFRPPIYIPKPEMRWKGLRILFDSPFKLGKGIGTNVDRKE
jgi:hypothetical protein